MQGQISHIVKVNVSFVFDLTGAGVSSLACISYEFSTEVRFYIF